MKKFFGEFKKFITRGNVIDMSVGVIVGGAFTTIVNGLSDFILKPIINWILALVLGSDSLSDIYTYLKKVYVDKLDETGAVIGQEIDLTQSIFIDWGSFINAIINFLLIALVLFTIVKIINNISDPENHLEFLKNKIKFKQENNIKLNKKELKFLKNEEEKAKKAEEEKIALENAPKPITTEDLLVEIRDLLKNK